MITKENLVDLFEDAEKKVGKIIHQMYLEPIKVQGNTYLKAIELNAMQFNILLVNITRGMETSGEVWVDYGCLAQDLQPEPEQQMMARSAALFFYKIKGKLDTAEKAVLIETEYREHGNYAPINKNMLFLNIERNDFIKALAALRTTFDKVKNVRHLIHFTNGKTTKYEAAAAPCY